MSTKVFDAEDANGDSSVMVNHVVDGGGEELVNVYIYGTFGAVPAVLTVQMIAPDGSTRVPVKDGVFSAPTMFTFQAASGIITGSLSDVDGSTAVSMDVETAKEARLRVRS